jgi:hypothetical protein
MMGGIKGLSGSLSQHFNGEENLQILIDVTRTELIVRPT